MTKASNFRPINIRYRKIAVRQQTEDSFMDNNLIVERHSGFITDKHSLFEEEKR